MFLRLLFILSLFICYLGQSIESDFSLDSLIYSRVIDKQHADLYSKILTIDNDGRIKPFHTTASEILRKICRKTSLYNQNSSQIVLGMTVDPLLWQIIPLIKVSNDDILKILNKDKEFVSFVSFFENNQYLLSPYVESAY